MEARLEETRVLALEVLTVNLLVMISGSQPDGRAFLKAMLDQMLAGARQQSSPDLDPTQSDSFTQDLEAAVTRLAVMAEQQMAISGRA